MKPLLLWEFDMEKEYQVKITDYALGQLDAIQRYIAVDLQAPDTAARWLANMKTAMKTLAFMPARVALTEEEPWRREGIRKMIVKNHFVYFWIDEEKQTVWIIAVVYARRDQVNQLEKLEQQIDMDVEL